ncbi:MAG: GlsB/YeaQ/YmgE family stress response membrane protein [Pseudolabrys sp.]
MGIIAWIMVGLIAGFLAHSFLGGRGGILGNIAVGLVGAVVGGFLFSRLHIVVEPGFGGGLITATIGAVIFLAIWRAIRQA